MNALARFDNGRSEGVASPVLFGFGLVRPHGCARVAMEPPGGRHAAENRLLRLRRVSGNCGTSRWQLENEARQPEEPALPTNRQGAVLMIEPCAAVRDAHLPDVVAKINARRADSRSHGHGSSHRPATSKPSSNSVNLVGADLIALGQIGLLQATAAKPIFAFSAASIFVRCDGTAPSPVVNRSQIREQRRRLIGKSASPPLSFICFPAPAEAALV